MAERELPVRSFQELVEQLYNFQPVLSHYKRQYESLDLFQRDLYIEPSATANDGAALPELSEFVTKWVESPQGVHLTLLGDFGSGKTTFCEWLTYQLSTKRIASGRIPLFVRLKDFGSAISIRAVITSILVNDLHLDIDYKAFELLNKSGRFVLILDGSMNCPVCSPRVPFWRCFENLTVLLNRNRK